MNREEKVAYEIVRQRIVAQLDRLEAAQKSGQKLPGGDINSLKKWRRFGAAFAWDPSVYQGVLANPDMSDTELISEIRKTEATFMRRWGYVNKIPLHHDIASRTGGDLGIRTPVDVWLETRERVFDATGARPGNGQANLNATGAFDELWHLGREGAKGSVFEGTGIITPEDFPYLHRAGQNLAEKLGANPGMVQASAAEQAKALIASIVQQQQRFKEVTATPQVQAQRKVFTDLGYSEIVDPTATMEEMVDIERATRKTPIPSIFAKAGSLRFNPRASMQEFISSEEGQAWFKKESARRAAQGKPFNPYNLYAAFGSIQDAERIMSLVKQNLPGEAAGALYGMILDPTMRKAIERGDLNTVLNTLGKDIAIGGAVQAGLSNLMQILPQQLVQKAAPTLAAGATAASVATPVAAVSQIEGSVDPTVTQQKAVKRLQQGSTVDIQRKQYLPQEYGAQGPQLDPTTGKVITEPKPLISGDQLVQQGITFINGVVKMFSPSQSTSNYEQNIQARMQARKRR